MVELSDELKIGETIHIKGIKGATTDFTQKVESMQIERQPVQRRGKRESIGFKISKHAREGGKVYKIIK